MLMLNLFVTLVSSAGLLCGPQDFQNRELFPCHPLPQHLRAGALRDVFNLPSCSVICFSIASHSVICNSYKHHHHL